MVEDTSKPHASLPMVVEMIRTRSVRLHAPLSGGRERAPFASDVLVRGDSSGAVGGREPFLASDGSSGGALVRTAVGEDGTIALHGGTGTTPFLRITAEEAALGGPVLTLKVSHEEAFYGFGEWFNAFQRTEGTVDFFGRESPAFTQKKQTYSSFPCFLSDAGYLVLVLNGHPGQARLHRPPGTMTLQFTGGEADLLVVYGPRFKDVIEEYTGLTGRPPLLPLWAFGLWNTSYPVEDAEATLARVRKHRTIGIPLDCVILDYHWENAFHDFQWRAKLFPDPPQFLGQMQKSGVRLGLIYTPFMNRSAYPLFKLAARLYARNAPDGSPLFAREAVAEVYTEGLSRGYFAADDVVWWLGRGGMIDVTNPEAVEWWFAAQRHLLDQGVAFFKNDDGEYLPEVNRSWSGLRAPEYHNLYGFYYGRAVFTKSQQHLSPDRALVFSRMVWAGSQRFPAVFLGDQRPRYQDLQRALRAGLNLSVLGFSYWAADVLGLYRRPTREIHQRYSQATLLGPIARYFSTPRDRRRDPWGHGDECLESFRTHADLRMQLLPYLYSQARLAFDTGWPIVRPLLLEYQEDERARSVDDQFLVGDRLLVAPVLEKGALAREVYFPEGRWYDWWTGRWYDGPSSTTVTAPLHRLPLFVRGGAPLVLGAPLQHIPPAHAFLSLAVHAFPPFTGRTVVYEDDGESLRYTEGRFSWQTIEIRSTGDAEDPRTIAITMEPALGQKVGPPVREWRLILHTGKRPVAIRIDRKPAAEETWTHRPPVQELHISCRAPTDRILRVDVDLE